MNAELAINKIKEKIAYIENLRNEERFSPNFKKWHRETILLLIRIFGEDSYSTNDFRALSFLYKGRHRVGDTEPFERHYRKALAEARAILTSIYEEIEEYGLESPEAGDRNPLSNIELLFQRFHSVARQLRQRHADRATLDISDEYDVQDLLHSLLRIYFKDIRPEEWTPSYAASSSRMDFLLHDEEIVIETKMTRKNFKISDLVDELIIDISRYKEHPRCKLLVCFVYDPEGYIGNTAALVKDIESHKGDYTVRAYVYPEIT